MNNIIWNKTELKNIKKILLNKTIFTIDADNDLVKKTKSTIFSSVGLLHLSKGLQEILKELYYITDKEEINQILTKASNIKVDNENKLHNVFITNLSNIDPEHSEEIFTIFKEIITLYNQTTYKVIVKEMENIKEIKDMELMLERIKESNEESIEELIIKNEINKVLNYTNGITEYNLISKIIDELNQNLKSIIINRIFQYIGSKKRALDSLKNKDTNAHFSDLDAKLKKDKLKDIQRGRKNRL